MSSYNDRYLDGKVFTCEWCNDIFTRQSSLSRHQRRTCKAQQKPSPYSASILKPKVSSVEKQSNIWQTDTFNTVLTPADPDSSNLELTPADPDTSNSVLIPADVKYVKDLCVRLEKNNKSLLVIAVDNDKCEWYGSTLAKQFSADNPSVIDQFFAYCQDKNQCSDPVIVKVEKESECTTSTEHLDITREEEDCNVISDNINVADTLVGSDNNTADEVNDDDGTDSKLVVDDDETDCSAGDEADDVDDDDSDDDYVDEIDKQTGKNADTTNNTSSVKPTDRKTFFQELAEDFGREERTKSVDYILKKTWGVVRNFVYTVPDLNTGRYKCDVCGYNFIWKVHLDIHKAKNPKCSEMKIISTENEALNNKVTFVHSELNVQITSTLIDLFQSNTSCPLVCEICGYKDIYSRDEFSKHLIKHYDENAFKCNICCSGFHEVKKLSQHLREHFRKPYECYKCEWRFPSDAKFDMHIQSGCCRDSKKANATTTIKTEQEMNESFFKCTKCFKMLIGHAQLREHMTTVHQCVRGPLECVLCDKRFSFPELYFTHLAIHRAEKYTCPYCIATFPEKSSAYHYHIKRHTDQVSPYMCDMCGEKFKIKRYFDNHRRKHTGERPYACTEKGCVKNFRSAEALSQHMWAHKNIHFLCSYCGRKFKKPSLLNNHKKTHTEDWRYTCSYCSERFRTLWTFKKHLAHHHPDKVADIKQKYKITLHPCDMCPKVYYEMEDFRSHMNTHKGIKPFACTYCGRRFTDKSNMKVHEKTHTGGKRLKCDICSRKFDDEKFLKSHIERLHNLDKPSPIQPQNTYNYTVSGQQLLDMENADELRERTLQIIDETIREEVKF